MHLLNFNFSTSSLQAVSDFSAFSKDPSFVPPLGEVVSHQLQRNALKQGVVLSLGSDPGVVESSGRAIPSPVAVVMAASRGRGGDGSDGILSPNQRNTASLMEEIFMEEIPKGSKEIRSGGTPTSLSTADGDPTSSNLCGGRAYGNHNESGSGSGDDGGYSSIHRRKIQLEVESLRSEIGLGAMGPADEPAWEVWGEIGSFQGHEATILISWLTFHPPSAHIPLTSTF